MNTAEAPLGPPPEPPISPAGALAGTFTQPGRTFERLAKRPTWWLPFVLSLVVALASVMAISPKMDVERSVRLQMEKRAETTGQAVSEAQVQQGVAFSRKFAALTPVFAVVFAAAAFFVVGLVLWGAAQAFGGETRYAQTLAVWAHGQLPNVVSGIVAIPAFLSRPDASITSQEAATVLKSSLGAFLSLDTPAAVRALAGSVDLFSFLTLALLVVGFRRLPGLTKSTGAAVPIACWLLWVVVKTVWMGIIG